MGDDVDVGNASDDVRSEPQSCRRACFDYVHSSERFIVKGCEVSLIYRMNVTQNLDHKSQTCAANNVDECLLILM